MVEQVRVVESYVSDGVYRARSVFAFGTHPMATALDAHPVTTALAATNQLRVIMDELLRGNNLEEIECRAIVDDDNFDRVPLGATPDDIARCAVAQDVLPARCPGSNQRSVCICKLDAGCVDSAGSFLTPKGQSVGVADVDQDGAADNTQFIQGAVTLACDGIAIALDLDASYWTPSGDQQKPAQGGFDVLGPAIVLVPGVALPTGATCGVTFSPEVVDKDGNQVCAPPGGDLASGCTPGDTQAIGFTVEPLRFDPVAGFSSTKPQSRTADFFLTANVPLDAATVGGITVADGAGAPYTDFTATLSGTRAGQITIHWTAAGGLAAQTSYTITVPTTVTDATYHRGAAQPVLFTFTTTAT